MAASLIACGLLAFAPPQERPDDPLAVALGRLDAAVAAASGSSPDEPSLLVSLAVDVLYQPFPDEASTRDVVARVAAAARPFAARAGDESGVALEFELANCALDRGEPFLAAELLEPARARWPGDLGLAALAVEQAMQLGEWRAAADRLVDAERLHAHDPFGAGLLELERTLFELRLGRADRALPRLEALLADATLPADVRSLAVGNLVDLHLLCDRPAEAAALRERAGRLGLDAEAPELALRFALARAAATKGDDARTALAELEGRLADRRLGATSRTLGMLRAGELALDFDEFERAAAWLDAADARLAAARKAAPTDGAARAARREQAMLAALRARLARRTASDDADRRRAAGFAHEAFDRLLEEWRATPLLPGGLSFLRSAARRSVLHEALLAALQEGGPEVALGRLIEAQALGTWARRADLAPPPLAAVRRALLSSREGLLAYLPADDSSHLFAVTRDEVVHFDLPDEATIDRALAASASDPTSTRGTALRDLLLPAELRTRLREWTLVRIVGAELLGDVAFEALPFDDHDGDGTATLGERIAVAYLPSIPVGVHLRERGASRASAAGLDLALVVGPTALPDGSARFEVDETALLRPFARSRKVVLATDALARAELELPDASAAFFVAHGVVDRSRDRFCGLLLAADADGAPAIAWADAFERSRLPPLVALVACSAGEGPIRVGEDGASHLGGAALSGGASSVLLGRGMLDGEANLALLEGFARALAAGAPSAEALRRARVELAREPRLARRARLELVGLGDEIVASGSIARASEGDDERRRALVLAIGGGLLLLVGGWLLRASRRSRSSRSSRSSSRGDAAR